MLANRGVGQVLVSPSCMSCRPRPAVIACAAVRTEEAYFNKLFSSLDHALSLARPQKSVLLALDGPAPLAKLLLQR
jgi:5'-3' exonuclease